MRKRILSDRLRYSPGMSIHPKRVRPDSDAQQAAWGAVLAHIQRGDYQFVERICPNCRQAECSLVSSVERHGFYMPIVVCEECGFVYSNPALRESDYAHFYENYYRKLYNGHDELPGIAELNKKKEKNIREIKRYFEMFPIEQLRQLGRDRVLDVGCGAGNFTMAWNECGFCAVGIDLDETYMSFGRNQGLDLRWKAIKELPDDEKFDIILYHHSLEHMLTPMNELSLATSHLRGGGYLIVVVPGLFNAPNKYLGDLRDYFHLAHPSVFTGSVVRSMAEKAGLRCVYCDEHIRACFCKDYGDPAFSDTETVGAQNASHADDVLRFLNKLENEFGTEDWIYKRLEEKEQEVVKRYERKINGLRKEIAARRKERNEKSHVGFFRKF